MLSYLSKKIIMKSISNKPLRVPFHSYVFKGKRVHLRASLTIEAALGLPLILFSMVVLMMPLRIMDADRQMQLAAEAVASDVSKYMYTANEIEHGRNASTEGEAYDFLNIKNDVALGTFAAVRAKEEATDKALSIVNFMGSEFMHEDDMITVKLEYSYKLPFAVLGLGTLTQETVASRRAWTGRDGSGGAVTSGELEEGDEWVYIGRNSTRYHLSASCHYLSNSWSTSVVGNDGRASGKKPCDRCGRAAATGQTVYITPSGEKYHTDINCSAMKAYPQIVKRSTVEHMGCCSYCGGHFNAD